MKNKKTEQRINTVNKGLAKIRLEELRRAIRDENISYGEIAELQDLIPYIEKDDVELLEWAGVPEVKSLCLDCLEEMEIETDIQLCQKCMKNYDTDRLWKDHDNNKIDALDFNESEQFRQSYKLK